MKKKLAFIMFMIFLLAVLNSCSDHGEHIHKWNDGEIVNNATCIEAGLIAYSCKDCGETKIQVVNALGHKEVIDVAIPPTCDDVGLTEGKHCELCGEILVKQKQINQLEHEYLDYICKLCGYSYCSDGLQFYLNDDGNSYSVCGYKGSEINIIIPSIYKGLPVTNIASKAFMYSGLNNNDKIEYVKIPNTIISIELAAFDGCKSLKQIEIPNSVESIGYQAFSGCDSLEIVKFPNSVKYIEAYVFRYCDSLTTVILPNTIITIEGNMFKSCSGVKIFCEISSKPSGWDSDWNGSNKVYWAGQWKYDSNGNPIPLS